MFSEAGNGLAAEGSDLPFNESYVVTCGIRAVRDCVLAQGQTSGCARPVYKEAPQTEDEWRQMFRDAGIAVLSVRAENDYQAHLTRLALPLTGGPARWVCVLNRCQSARGCCRSLCRQYCEWLMADCSTLGYGRPERFPGTTLAEMRRQIADAVTAELC